MSYDEILLSHKKCKEILPFVKPWVILWRPYAKGRKLETKTVWSHVYVQSKKNHPNSQKQTTGWWWFPGVASGRWEKWVEVMGEKFWDVPEWNDMSQWVRVWETETRVTEVRCCEPANKRQLTLMKACCRFLVFIYFLTHGGDMGE